MIRRGRLWMVTRSLPAHIRGGMERIAFDTAVGLAARGWEIDLVTTKLDAPHRLPPAIRVHPLDAPGGRHSARFRRELVRWAESHDDPPPDLIFSVSFAAAPLLTHMPRVPSIVQLHGSAWGEAMSKLRRLDPRALYRLALHLGPEKEALAAATRVIATGPAVSEMLASPRYRFVDATKIAPIPNGIDASVYERVMYEDRDDARRALGVPEGDRVIVSACRMIRSKGVWSLLEGYEAMEDRESTTLLLLGDGREREAMRRFCERRGLGRARLLGTIDRERVARVLRVADLVVQISIAPEGLPLVVLEALSAGAAVLVSDRVRLPAYEGEEGVLAADPSHIGEVAAALHRGVRLGAPFTLGARAARREFSLDTMLDRYEALMEEAIAERGGGRASSSASRRRP